MSPDAVLLRSIWSALDGDRALCDRVTFAGEGALPSAFAVTDLASASIAAAGLAIAELQGSEESSLRVDRRLSSMWFATSIRPLGWKLPAVWDPIAGDYLASNGWIRLHTNAPHHRSVVERVLGVDGDRAAVARAVKAWTTSELEEAVVESGGCAAEMRSLHAWEEHPQGSAVASEPLVHLETISAQRADPWSRSKERPLRGVRVLDLTRVLAGPVATRFLAGYGADVLRIDPPQWDEPALAPEVTLGKRCARLDLRAASDRAIFEKLLTQADVLIHGYRPGALDALGYDAERRQRLSPGIVDVWLSAYGYSGPWKNRRGFDSLVQMSTGIAEYGMAWAHVEKPFPLPVQALDHATGYIMAAAAIRGLARRAAGLGSVRARLSLARTARLLIEAGTRERSEALTPESESDVSAQVERTQWGDAKRLVPPVSIVNPQTPMSWDVPASPLGSSEPRWQQKRSATL